MRFKYPWQRYRKEEEEADDPHRVEIRVGGSLVKIKLDQGPSVKMKDPNDELESYG